MITPHKPQVGVIPSVHLVISNMVEHETHSEIMRALGRLEGKVDGILEQATKTNGRVTKLEQDTGEIKQWKSNLMGKFSVITLVLSSISAYLTKRFLE